MNYFASSHVYGDRMKVITKGDSRHDQIGTIVKIIPTSEEPVLCLLFKDGAREMFLNSELKAQKEGNP